MFSRRSHVQHAERLLFRNVQQRHVRRPHVPARRLRVRERYGVLQWRLSEQSLRER